MNEIFCEVPPNSGQSRSLLRRIRNESAIGGGVAVLLFRHSKYGFASWWQGEPPLYHFWVTLVPFTSTLVVRLLNTRYIALVMRMARA